MFNRNLKIIIVEYPQNCNKRSRSSLFKKVKTCACSIKNSPKHDLIIKYSDDLFNILTKI